MGNSSPNDAPKPWDIHFGDNYFPLLRAGRYTIKVEQELKGSGAQSVPSGTAFKAEQEFRVIGPRFRLDPADIQQMYPPPNSQGAFGNHLPHIVLTKPTLPWERTIFGGDTTIPANERKTIPWMALLLFDASEICPPQAGTEQDNQPANLTRDYAVEVKKLRDTENGIVTGFNQPGSPTLDSPGDAGGEPNCQVIEITLQTFRKVMPQWDELKYLTHCREVALAQKALPGPDRPGAPPPPGGETAWYSVVVGGRFPGSPPSGEQRGELNVVHLVSLEGLERYIKGTEGKPGDHIRLVSLAHWAFTCLPASGEDFGELMRGLVPRAFRLAFEQDESDKDRKFASAMLTAGYVPRSYHTRQGENTFAWYRGPFTPQPVPPLPDGCPRPFASAAQAIIYDPDHGLFDLSYAVAWETGRLLALSDARFGTLLLNRRRQARHLVDLLQARIRYNSAQPLRANLVSELSIKYLVGDFAGQIADTNFWANGEPPVDAEPESRPPTITPHSLLEEYHKEHKADVIQSFEQNGREDLDPICDWLTQLYLLYGVPFNNLLPDERLLPRESIRFFYLDRNWLDALLDGALSIGMHSSRDKEYQELVYAVIAGEVHRRIHALRDTLLGKPGQPPPMNDGEGPMAGLLLRSAVVAGWPGLEVRAYSHSDGRKGSGTVRLLRMDRPAGDMLLCIFNQVPAWIEFDEPREGLHFGVRATWDGKAEIDLRYLKDDGGQRVGEPHGTFPLRPEWVQDRKLKVLDLVKGIAKSGLPHTDELGPAGLTLQMVRVPQQMVFQTTRS